MGASESIILYQNDIAGLFPAGEIDLSFACQIVKCTPEPKNTIEDFGNKNNTNNYNYKYLIIFILIFLFILLLLFYK